jgi:hypothetical protein
MTDTIPPPAKASRIARPIKAARDAALTTAERTAQAIEGNPMSVLVGGLAVGVIAGALLPRGDREAEALRPVGERLKQGAMTALRAARDAGAAELAAAGISRDAARVQIARLIDAVSNAATRAGEAAAEPTKAAKKKK